MTAIPLYCPWCKAEAEALNRSGPTLTNRFECPACRLRFSILKQDLDRRAALIDAAANYG